MTAAPEVDHEGNSTLSMVVKDLREKGSKASQSVAQDLSPGHIPSNPPDTWADPCSNCYVIGRSTNNHEGWWRGVQGVQLPAGTISEEKDMEWGGYMILQREL